MRRRQARLTNGKWTPNTMENTFGLRLIICPACGQFNPYGRKPVVPDAGGLVDPALVGQWDQPSHCHGCGTALAPDDTANGESPR